MLSEKGENTETKETKHEKPLSDLADWEMEVVTKVFRSFETGLREGTILPKDLNSALKMLGLNPLEQEVLDLTNEIARDGFIYFPQFCQAIHRKYREEDEEVFRQNMFKIICGTKPYPDNIKAKKYKLSEHFFTRNDFVHMMKNLPVEVADSDIDEMFSYADADCDGKINWLEFQTMINPPQGVVQGTSKQGRVVKEKEVTFHPETLSVTSMLRQSQGGRSSRVTPLEFSDTHVAASWSDIGLPVPVTVPEPVPGTRRRF